MAAEFGGRRAAAAAGGRVAGNATPTGLRAAPDRAIPRSIPLRSEYIDSPEGQRGGTEDDSVDSLD